MPKYINLYATQTNRFKVHALELSENTIQLDIRYSEKFSLHLRYLISDVEITKDATYGMYRSSTGGLNPFMIWDEED